MSKSIKKRKLRLNISRFLLITLVLYIGFKFWDQSRLRNELTYKRTEKEIEHKKLEREISILEDEIENSDSLNFVEKIARDELGMVKPREIIIIDKERVEENSFKAYK